MSARKQVNAAGQSSSTAHKPKLGQNFLVDASAARRIVEALGSIDHATVVEIGPGRGALTRALAERAGGLIAVEFDLLLADKLRAQFAGRSNVEIVSGNFLESSLSELLERRQQSRAKVVGNIPYYITSDILLRLFEQHESIETVVIMLQKEVADRIVAVPGTRDYGVLTVTAQLFADVERLFTLPPGAFSPPPQVYSSVLRLRIAPKSMTLGVNPEQFLTFCKLAFAQKRKTLLNNLRSRYGQSDIRQAVHSLAVPQEVRAEALSIEQLAVIYRGLQTQTK
jgi:16S rRNA (adenine1518-N6/adenine1519-N6)-dimethyltransferase